MRTREVERFEKQLKERKEQILKNIYETKLELDGLADSEINDEGDFATISTDNMIDSAITAQQQKELADIELAISKFHAGRFGICEMCNEKISMERLKVKPQARYCIVCREIHEKNARS